MEEKNNEALRLAVIALLIALTFGILQHYGEQTFDSVGMDIILKVSAIVFLYVLVPLSTLYLVLMGVNLRYHKRRIFSKLQFFFYDLNIALAVLLLVLVLLLSGAVKLLLIIPSFPMSLLVSLIWIFGIGAGILSYLLVEPSLSSLLSFLPREFKLIKQTPEPIFAGDQTKIPTGSNWKKILLEIYRNSPHMWGYSKKMQHNDDRHPLAKKLKITGYELMLGLSFLEGHKLIKTSVLSKEAFSAQWILMQKGFDVALDLEKLKSNLLMNASILYFTMIIAITGAFALFSSLGLIKPLDLFIYYILAIAIAAMYSYRKLLNPLSR